MNKLPDNSNKLDVRNSKFRSKYSKIHKDETNQNEDIEEIDNAFVKLGLSELKKHIEMNSKYSNFKNQNGQFIASSSKNWNVKNKESNSKFVTNQKPVCDMTLQAQTIKHDITVSSIKSNFLEKENVRHLKKLRKHVMQNEIESNPEFTNHENQVEKSKSDGSRSKISKKLKKEPKPKLIKEDKKTDSINQSFEKPVEMQIRASERLKKRLNLNKYENGINRNNTQTKENTKQQNKNESSIENKRKQYKNDDISPTNSPQKQIEESNDEQNKSKKQKKKTYPKKLNDKTKESKKGSSNQKISGALFVTMTYSGRPFTIPGDPPGPAFIQVNLYNV